MFTSENRNPNLDNKYEIKILSLTDAFPYSLVSLIEENLKINISITLADDISHFTELNEENRFDLLFYKSYFINHVLQSQNLEQITIDKLKNIKNIQADFWPSQKYNSKKSIPYAWGINGYSTLKNEENTDLGRNKDRLIFFGKNYDYFFHYFHSKYPEIKKWIQTSKDNHLREFFKKTSTYISFYSQLSPQIFEHYVSLSNGEHSKITSTQPGLRFVIPEYGGLFWMNLISLTQSGASKDITHQFIDFLLSRNSQLQMTSHEHLSSITEIDNNFFQSAKYIRSIPISKIYFPLDTLYDPKSWVFNLKVAFPDISNSNEDSL